MLKGLDETLKRVVYGQDAAITALTSAIKLARAGLRDPEKPIGNYLFAGPTGVGKTEVARQLSKSLGVELIRFDMSEVHGAPHTVSRLIGAPPGYVGFDQGRPAHRRGGPAPALRAAAGRDREGPSGSLQHPPADHGPREADRPQRQAGRLPKRHPDHDDERRRGRPPKPAFGFTRSKRDGDDNEAINRLFAPEFATASTRSSRSASCRRRWWPRSSTSS